MVKRPTQTLRAIIEPPSAEDEHWLMSAPAINYFVQGDTRDEVIEMFEEGVDDAIDFFTQGKRISQNQPELIEYEIRA
jgi:predicted RNase H-like HicB family nuclease